MSERRRFSPPTVGGSSLLVIFAVLCLTVFALLSLSTVQADGRLSQTSAEAAQAYYAADCRRRPFWPVCGRDSCRPAFKKAEISMNTAAPSPIPRPWRFGSAWKGRIGPCCGGRQCPPLNGRRTEHLDLWEGIPLI